MTKNNQPIEKPESHYIKGIQDGTIRVSSLSKETILDIVEVLYAEGSSAVQIAQLLDRNDRSVRRYLEAIRARNAVEPSAQRAKELVGELIQKAMASHSSLRRLAQSKTGSIGDKAQAEFAAWRVYKEFINILQTLGYLPQKPQEIVSDVFYHSADADGEKDIVEIRAMLLQIEQTAKEVGTYDDKTKEQLKALQIRVENAELTSEVKKLESDINKTKEQKQESEESNG